MGNHRNPGNLAEFKGTGATVLSTQQSINVVVVKGNLGNQPKSKDNPRDQENLTRNL